MHLCQERYKLPSVSETPEQQVASGDSSVSSCLQSFDGKETPKTSGRGRDVVDSEEAMPLLDRPQNRQSAESELNGAVSTDTIEKGKVCSF